MVRINLLPPEIVQKRKAEKLFGFVALGAVVIALVLVAVYGAAVWIVSGRAEELQAKKSQAADLAKAAEAFKIFEDKQTDLAARQATADTALAQRVEWSRLMNELSLVLPEEAWLIQMRCDEKAEPNVSLGGVALDPEDSPDGGHKVIAKALVRLAGLEQLNNVWLSSSEKVAGEEGDEGVINFLITAGVVKPAAPSAPSAAVPAPPTGQ